MKISVNPSYLGFLDINVYSSSNPGLNGSIVPFAQMKGLYFDDKMEPQGQAFRLSQALDKMSEEEGNLVFDYGDTPEKFYATQFDLLTSYLAGFKAIELYNDEMLHFELLQSDTIEVI